MPRLKNKTRVILALDVDTLEEAKRFVNRLYPAIKIFKIGSRLFTSYGPRVVEMIRSKGAEVFLDLKYFDIPNTVAGAVEAATRLRVKMLTLHVSGGSRMLQAAVEAARRQAKALKIPRPLLLGVTVLTSQESGDKKVLSLARQGLQDGLDGIVCSARESGALRRKIKKDFIIVTPGIRPGGSGIDDQKRTATVAEAVKAGSDFLVIGRPILKAADPLSQTEEILGDLNGAGN
ncbi:MAG: orotidine-5'-phosphate decarboxylase [Candidatus Omnitrophica bacterium]|jgi:orotidine-5'-phosphate decarboxylase|nr:orotidine-5'-phosphate decarboxylase [Candidatus Omnitrophota bacterium]MDD5077457.1 orotidine-5'-phosphate decarboxylase [Candidatus Omnitrophota bacterium]MDD5725396.1 orotidine-5'-phosphate decarboxylase [Candidatus Omnitrophota bacterium]